MIHLIKLSVGTTSIEGLAAYRAEMLACGLGRPDGLAFHRTRMMPKRKEELINGGSIFWVFGGKIQCRQLVVDLEAGVDSEGRGFCDIVMDQKLIPTVPTPKRPFQGWRYFDQAKVPEDRDVYMLGQERDEPPEGMADDLREAGLL